MKKLFLFLIVFILLGCGVSCANDDSPTPFDESQNTSYFGGKKALIAYFSWGGTTQRMAQQLQDITGADIFRIEPVVSYPTEYTPCTEVAPAIHDERKRN